MLGLRGFRFHLSLSNLCATVGYRLQLCHFVRRICQNVNINAILTYLYAKSFDYTNLFLYFCALNLFVSIIRNGEKYDATGRKLKK